MPEPSPYWGDEADLDEQEQRAQPDARSQGTALAHVGGAAGGEPPECKEGSSHPSAKLFPWPNAGRHLAMYDPRRRS
jgi:hypothetical protein